MIYGDYEYSLDEKGNAIIIKYRGKAWELNVPDTLNGHTVVAIKHSAFEDCTSLRNITLPDSITSIGDSAFWGCESLSSITLPESLTSIGDEAFSRCKSLSSITLPKSIASIGDGAFSYCPSLTLTVSRNSYAAQYAEANRIPYQFR